MKEGSLSNAKDERVNFLCAFTQKYTFIKIFVSFSVILKDF